MIAYLPSSQCENLLPVDMVNIKGVFDRELAPPLVEGFCTSDSPWKEGTVAAILKCGQQCFGIYVHLRPMKVFDDICIDMDQAWTRFIIDQTVHVALLKFAAFEGDTGNPFNLMPMQYNPRFDLREVVDMLITCKYFGTKVIADLLLLWIVDRFIVSSGVLCMFRLL